MTDASNKKTALITGAARRIGAAIARQLHGKGYQLILHCHQSRQAADALAQDLCSQRANSAVVVTQDLSRCDELPAFIDRCVSQFDGLNCLVNNASAFWPTPIETFSMTAMNELLDTNLKAPMALSIAGRGHLAGGSIINIVDIYAEKPLPGYLAYSISKAGLAMLTRGLAVELAPEVRVNGVSPGAILWPEDDSEMSDDDKQQRLTDVPMGRLGRVEDIARTVGFLADDAAFTTGQIIAVDGGQLLN